MIKKMLAMLVAISCAFGAWADTHISGTDFTGLTDGPFVLGLDDSGNDTGTTFWYNGDESDFEGTIVDGGSANYLDFESNITNPLYRTISSCYEATSPSQFTATPIGTGLFIDTHVQFTPYLVNENHPAPSTLSTDDKLIVWVRETEVDGDANITNLIITAGYIAGNGNVSASNYVASLSSAAVSALCDGQHRLTIKSYQNITAHSGVTVMGFVVYVDETVVEYIGDAFADGSVFLPLVPGPAQYYSQGGGHNKLLPCLMDYGTDPSAIDSYSKLTAVGYAGMGKIGDVIFDNYNTTYPAFAGDDLAFQVVLGDGVTSFDYLGETYETNASFTVEASTASVTISNVLYDTTAGYTHKTGTWHNNVPVDNQVGAGGDYGTFLFANGTILTLVGFQANYIVNGTEYDNLTDALEAALAGGYPLVLNNDVEITEGDGSLTIGENETLVLDLKGHTIKGTGDQYTPTIMNMGGTLTIIDTSSNHDGKVLNCDNAGFCLVSYTGSSTSLDAGIYEDIDDNSSEKTTITINGGTYRDVVTGPDSFYLEDCLGSGKEVIDWIQDGDDYYAVIGEPSGDTWDITFSTNNVVVSEWNLTVNDGDPIGNHIPNFTGGSWDAPAPTAETIVTSDTNFNYTIAVQLSYFPQTAIEQEWADRNGTAAKPFAIRNAADFAGLKSDIAEGYNADKYFEVVVDNITLTDWTGIGSSSKPFSGTLIGGGKTVNITFSNAKDNGLFAYVSNATLSNLTVNASSGTIGGSTGGAAFVGKAAGVTTFVALKATGSLGSSVTPTTHNTAGICERIDTGDSSWIINFNSCTNAMTIYANYTKVGGILAFRDGKSAEVNFTNCVNSANINNAYATSGQHGTGGIMGWTGGTDLGTGITRINGCVNTGTITAADGSAGNFIGYENYSATASGTNIGLASLKPASNWPITGLDWASVSGDIATFVTPVATVTDVVSYKVMQAASTPNFTLAAAAASLTIDTSLAAYTGTVSVDSTLSEDYNLRETAIANGTIYSLESKTPSDPWAPTAETDEAAAAKIADLFPGSEVAANVTTYAMYTNLVDYIKDVTSSTEVPTDLTSDQVDWLWKSYILGADPLFVAEPEVEITSLTAGSTAGVWKFTVQVTDGTEVSPAVHEVVANKVKALVKTRASLTSGSWAAPATEDISATQLLGGNTIEVTIDFGDGTSGFMKVSE